MVGCAKDDGKVPVLLQRSSTTRAHHAQPNWVAITESQNPKPLPDPAGHVRSTVAIRRFDVA
jgi:hypothetical protein